MKIEFNAVRIRTNKFKAKILRTIRDVLTKGILLNGPENEQLEQKLRKYFKEGYVTLTAGGHYSLIIALRALKLKKNDEIIMPSNSYPTAFAIAHEHIGKIKMVDVDESGLLDTIKVKKAITSKTRAIVIVHLYGHVYPTKELRKICGKKKIVLIEDCAQAFGSYHGGKAVGTYSDIACYSFYPTKNLGGIGDGGALWTKNKKYYNFFRRAVSYGEKVRYKSLFISDHSRLSEIEAATLNLFFTLMPYEKRAKKTGVPKICRGSKPLRPIKYAPEAFETCRRREAQFTSSRT